MTSPERNGTTPSGSLCACGHPKAVHRAEKNPYIGRDLGPCHATIYTHVSMGMNVTRCKCRKYVGKAA